MSEPKTTVRWQELDADILKVKMRFKKVKSQRAKKSLVKLQELLIREKHSLERRAEEWL